MICLRWALSRSGLIGLIIAAGLVAAMRSLPGTPQPPVPHYDHIFVIIDENKDYEQLLNQAVAPNMARWAGVYGAATQFYSEVHPSEANYVALLGGDTFGIHDDDAFYCRPQLHDPECPKAGKVGYVDHTVHAPHLGDQLIAHGLSWKGYYEDIPTPGSLAVWAGGPTPAPARTGFYSSKHSGFVNFASVQSDPKRAEHLVGFDQFDRDLSSDRLPNFALIVPNQCNDMHDTFGCDIRGYAGKIRRGDEVLGALVAKIQRSRAWQTRQNIAIVITFDENGGKNRRGCCSVLDYGSSSYGGGHIPTVVVTNHGRGGSDDTPYNHYSLLRTIEDSFGIKDHLRHAADLNVAPMTPLFRVDR